MAKSFPHSLVLILFTILSTLSQSILAVKYVAINDAKQFPGGARFEREIGIPYTLQIMKKINLFIYKMFQQKIEGEKRTIDTVHLYIQQFDGAEGITYGDHVNVSALYLQGYQGNLKWEFTSLLYHELTHVFQWISGPMGLVEGIADYTILKANYYPPGFAKPGQGDRWDQGYDITARFLEYCDSLKSGFVAALNRKMKDGYSDDYFVELLGKPVNQLWSEYKARYNHNAVLPFAFRQRFR
ncbi:uncharacterized protein LOC127262353 [Andrographis paniculata]|uniref:uncharacterized protein LOC127262353 n=1 Tax=Andrographis paniculata TaxID=175694 RepID=UPI0021E96E26|nr:uncharacterized protein LOC127262353 [Andrographis paniculata]